MQWEPGVYSLTEQVSDVPSPYTSRLRSQGSSALGTQGRAVTYGRGRPDLVPAMLRWIPAAAVLVALLAVSPLWPWSRGWGWAPAGMVAVTLVTIVLFTLSIAPA